MDSFREKITDLLPEISESSDGWNYDIRLAIVCLMLTDKDFLAANREQIKIEFFSEEVHREMIRFALNFFDKRMSDGSNEQSEESSKPLDWDKIGSNMLPDKVIVRSQLEKLWTADAETQNVLHAEIEHVYEMTKLAHDQKEFIQEEVDDFCKKEAIKAALRDCFETIRQEELGDERFEIIRSTMEKALQTGRVDASEIVYFERYKDRILEHHEKKKDKNNRTKIFTIGGLDSIDKTLTDGGLGVGEIAIFLGKPGSGKSVMLANVAFQNLLRGYRVLFVTLENSVKVVENRFDSLITESPYYDIMNSPTTAIKKIDTIAEMIDSKEALVIESFNSGTMGMSDLQALLFRLKSQRNFVPDLLVLDYLDETKPVPNTKKHEWQELRARELRALAQAFDLSVVTATQTNRSGEDTNILEGREIGDSYGKLRIADCFYSLNYDEQERARGLIRVFVIKQRNGQGKFTCYCKCDYARMKIKEIARDKFDELVRKPLAEFEKNDDF